jgi:hypothetical protein
MHACLETLMIEFPFELELPFKKHEEIKNFCDIVLYKGFTRKISNALQISYL